MRTRRLPRRRHIRFRPCGSTALVTVTVGEENDECIVVASADNPMKPSEASVNVNASIFFIFLPLQKNQADPTPARSQCPSGKFDLHRKTPINSKELH
jgi:hypothetical protein